MKIKYELGLTEKEARVIVKALTQLAERASSNEVEAARVALKIIMAADEHGITDADGGPIASGDSDITLGLVKLKGD